MTLKYLNDWKFFFTIEGIWEMSFDFGWQLEAPACLIRALFFLGIIGVLWDSNWATCMIDLCLARG